MDVTLQIKKNGGAPATGGITASIGDTIQPTALNKSQWPGNSVRWELQEYGIGFPLPAGWTQDTDDSTMPTYFCLGVADPPAFVVDRGGPYKTRVIVAGNVVDERTFVKVDYPSGVRPTARGEVAQFGGQKLQFVGEVEQNWKTIDAAIEAFAGGGVPTSRTLTAGAGLTGGGDLTANRTFNVGANADGSIAVNADDIQVGVLATDGQHGNRGGGLLHALAVSGGAAGFMSGTDKQSLANATPNPTPSTLCSRDGSANCSVNALYLATGGAFDALPVLSHPSVPAGAGQSVLMQAQAATSGGQAGGYFRFVVGAGHTPGTDITGDFEIDFGTSVGGISQPLSLQSLGIEWLNFHKDSSGVSTAVIHNSATKLRIESATLDLSDGTAVAATWSLAHSGASSLLAAAGVTAFSIGQTQHASAAGNPTTYGGQQGFAGFVGGDVFIKSGLGGTPGTNAGGKVRIDTGAAVAGQAAPISLESNGSAYGILQQFATGELLIGLPSIASYVAFQSTSATVSSTTVALSGSNITITGSGGIVTSNSNAFQVLDPTSSLPFFEFSHLAAASRVVSLCRNAAITTTNMPAGSGDGVENLANCTVEPTAAPDNTGIVRYAKGGQFKTVDSSFTIEEHSYVCTGTPVGSYQKVLKRWGSITYALASTSGAITTLKATDFGALSKHPMARVRWSLFGWNNTKSANFCQTYVTLVACVNGTSLVVSGTQADFATAINGTGNTYSGNATLSGSDIIFTVTSNSTDSMVWFVEFEAWMGAPQ